MTVGRTTPSCQVLLPYRSPFSGTTLESFICYQSYAVCQATTTTTITTTTTTVDDFMLHALALLWSQQLDASGDEVNMLVSGSRICKSIFYYTSHNIKIILKCGIIVRPPAFEWIMKVIKTKQSPGRFSGMICWDPSVSKSHRLPVDIFWFFSAKMISDFPQSLQIHWIFLKVIWSVCDKQPPSPCSLETNVTNFTLGLR